ncbi:MAG: AMP-binding protein [Lachnospiraceae bacterium]
MERLKQLREYVEAFSTAPTLASMPRRTLADKGIAGPTGAHVIEEVHTPFNYAYITVTTGTTAYQNLVGVTHQEVADRCQASVRALQLSGVCKNDKILFTYPPLVSVFTKEALIEYGAPWIFLPTSSRDALILTLIEEQPRVIVGESSFFNAALKDAVKMGLADLLPRGLIFIAAGTPLNLELLETAASTTGGTVHDLYGCQEFGLITLDGIELRDDITLIESEKADIYDLVVGGLHTGDSFPVTAAGHCCNPKGKIITYARNRARDEYETVIVETPASAAITIERLAKTVLRMKTKIVRVDPKLKLGSEHTVVRIQPYGKPEQGMLIIGPEKTRLLDVMLQAQRDYQTQSKTDPTWVKER